MLFNPLLDYIYDMSVVDKLHSLDPDSYFAGGNHNKFSVEPKKP